MPHPGDFAARWQQQHALTMEHAVRHGAFVDGAAREVVLALTVEPGNTQRRVSCEQICN